MHQQGLEDVTEVRRFRQCPGYRNIVRRSSSKRPVKQTIHIQCLLFLPFSGFLMLCPLSESVPELRSGFEFPESHSNALTTRWIIKTHNCPVGIQLTSMCYKTNIHGLWCGRSKKACDHSVRHTDGKPKKGFWMLWLLVPRFSNPQDNTVSPWYSCLGKTTNRKFHNASQKCFLEMTLAINPGCLISQVKQISFPIPTHSICYNSKCLGVLYCRSVKCCPPEKREFPAEIGLHFPCRSTWMLSAHIYYEHKVDKENISHKCGTLFKFAGLLSTLLKNA